MKQKLRPPESKSLSPNDLEFDFENPRLVDGDVSSPRSEKEMVRWLWDQADVSELVGSIAQSGWMPFDDMVVMRSQKSRGKFTVLEGNRRLAALKLFSQANLAAELNINLPDLSHEHRATFNEVTVKVVHSRDEARAFIGFKHVNGPHKWDAYAKAKFATDWLDAEGDLEEVARTLGDNNNTVRRLVVGFRVLEQARKLGFRPEEANSPRGFAFSHLYTALGQTGYQGHLGIDYNSDGILSSRTPVPANKSENLMEVIRWLYGNKSEQLEPVIKSQNPDLGHLNKVLGKTAALNILKSSNDLDAAYEEIESKSVRFVSALVNAYQSADHALKLSSGYDGHDESVQETSKGLAETADTLLGVVERKIKQSKKKPAPS